jgi:hypothetical protein
MACTTRVISASGVYTRKELASQVTSVLVMEGASKRLGKIPNEM